MKITAGALKARVDYRIPGKQYNVGNGEVEVEETAGQTKFPFESKDIEPGETFDAEGLEVVRVIEYKPYTGPEPLPEYAA